MTKQDELRRVVREWLEMIQEKHAISARAIATRSGVAPSTIYRWLDPDAAFVMSMTKLNQVSGAFSEPLPGELTGRQASGRPAAGFGESDLKALKGEMPEFPATTATNHGLFQLSSEVLDLEGFRPGDIIEFDMASRPEPGDIVVAQVYNFQNGTADTVLRLFEPPHLLTRSSDRSIDTRPLYVDGERVVIMGTWVRMMRERAA